MLDGDVAQMVEHSLSMRGARGSIPRISTLFSFFRLATDTDYTLWPLCVVRGCSSDGRALALHARGRGIDTPHFHCIVYCLMFVFSYLILSYLILSYLDGRLYSALIIKERSNHIKGTWHKLETKKGRKKYWSRHQCGKECLSMESILSGLFKIINRSLQ